MWPWEHLAVAYVLYSLLANGVRRRSPSTGETTAVVGGSQLPDLIDKPLAWTLGVTETGYAIGHSIFVAPLVCLAVYAAAVRRGIENRLVPGAFALAYASHLVTDVYDPPRPDRGVVLEVVLWPFASPPAADTVGF
ncbi:metal-dependent hydrolase [Natronolimnohabitans innermongolicus]|uniref:Membrane-bound metal-dependent hydrolase n=1 Tax=Natronolimnohabitans innermongolicus JCM 12255 TaxID=1227499 RepID=L9XG93_9EURY|nr:metal-dependent hydrolase [Natronolimnohabitans innermongolicus]ELY60622.1 membrane-bound metal-dependent hydrolase [Natronolimnohabitans innermongolicus JCM 12255]